MSSITSIIWATIYIVTLLIFSTDTKPCSGGCSETNIRFYEGKYPENPGHDDYDEHYPTNPGNDDYDDEGCCGSFPIEWPEFMTKMFSHDRTAFNSRRSQAPPDDSGLDPEHEPEPEYEDEPEDELEAERRQGEEPEWETDNVPSVHNSDNELVSGKKCKTNSDELSQNNDYWQTRRYYNGGGIIRRKRQAEAPTSEMVNEYEINRDGTILRANSDTTNNMKQYYKKIEIPVVLTASIVVDENRLRKGRRFSVGPDSVPTKLRSSQTDVIDWFKKFMLGEKKKLPPTTLPPQEEPVGPVPTTPPPQDEDAAWPDPPRTEPPPQEEDEELPSVSTQPPPQEEEEELPSVSTQPPPQEDPVGPVPTTPPPQDEDAAWPDPPRTEPPPQEEEEGDFPSVSTQPPPQEEPVGPVPTTPPPQEEEPVGPEPTQPPPQEPVGPELTQPPPQEEVGPEPTQPPPQEEEVGPEPTQPPPQEEEEVGNDIVSTILPLPYSVSTQPPPHEDISPTPPPEWVNEPPHGKPLPHERCYADTCFKFYPPSIHYPVPEIHYPNIHIPRIHPMLPRTPMRPNPMGPYLRVMMPDPDPQLPCGTCNEVRRTRKYRRRTRSVLDNDNVEYKQTFNINVQHNFTSDPKTNGAVQFGVQANRTFEPIGNTAKVSSRVKRQSQKQKKRKSNKNVDLLNRLFLNSKDAAKPVLHKNVEYGPRFYTAFFDPTELSAIEKMKSQHIFKSFEDTPLLSQKVKGSSKFFDYIETILQRDYFSDTMPQETIDETTKNYFENPLKTCLNALILIRETQDPKFATNLIRFMENNLKSIIKKSQYESSFEHTNFKNIIQICQENKLCLNINSSEINNKLNSVFENTAQIFTNILQKITGLNLCINNNKISNICITQNIINIKKLIINSNLNLNYIFDGLDTQINNLNCKSKCIQQLLQYIKKILLYFNQ